MLSLTEPPEAISKTQALDTAEAVLNTEDGRQFLNMLEATGKTTKKSIMASNFNKQEFTAEFHTWVNHGKPEAIMPEMNMKEKCPSQIVRVYDRGEPKFFVNFDDGTTEGRLERHTYGHSIDPVTGEKKPNNRVVGTTIEYTMKWDPSLIKKHISDAKRLARADQNWMMCVKNGDMYMVVDTADEFLKL